MINIRAACFETNSSSTHSMIIMSEEQKSNWEKGLILYNSSSRYNKLPEWVTLEEARDYVLTRWSKYLKDKSEDEILEYVYEDFTTSDQWYDNDYLEFDDEVYTTNSGEKIYVTCKYGYDG